MEIIEEVELEGNTVELRPQSGHVVTDDGVRVSMNLIALRMSVPSLQKKNPALRAGRWRS
jgi:hypothetical protein